MIFNKKTKYILLFLAMSLGASNSLQAYWLTDMAKPITQPLLDNKLVTAFAFSTAFLSILCYTLWTQNAITQAQLEKIMLQLKHNQTYIKKLEDDNNKYKITCDDVIASFEKLKQQFYNYFANSSNSETRQMVSDLHFYHELGF